MNDDRANLYGPPLPCSAFFSFEHALEDSVGRKKVSLRGPRPDPIEFQAMGVWLGKRYNLAKSSRRRSEPYWAEDNVLKRNVYGYIRHLERLGHTSALIAHLRKEEGRGQPSSNPFSLGFRLTRLPERLLNKQKRSKWAKQLLYAHRHDIYWRFLDCFLAVAGTSEQISKKLAGGSREAWATGLGTRVQRPVYRSVGAQGSSEIGPSSETAPVTKGICDERRPGEAGSGILPTVTAEQEEEEEGWDEDVAYESIEARIAALYARQGGRWEPLG